MQGARPTNDRVVEQRFEMFQSAANIYDATAPEASHLRAHQVEALRAFCDTLGSLSIDSFAEGSGIGVIMPTGSGKTVIAAEIMRLLKEGSATFLGDPDHTLRSLLLMPRHSISNQTLGKGEEESRGIQRFAPDLTLTKCTESPPTNPHDVHLGLYQGLTGLTGSGYLRKLDPTAVICDEMHHIIDGKWAKRVTDLAPGRLLVGLTATPEYGPDRNTLKYFPTQQSKEK